MYRIGKAGLGLGLALSLGSAASAQAWIGQVVGDMMARQQAAAQEHACMMGTPLNMNEVEETREPARLAMAKYWGVVSAGGERDINPVFEGDKDGRWVLGERELRQGKAVLVSDPLALPGAALEAEPVWLLRSGDGVHVRALFRVNGADGKVLGGYDVTLRRNLGRWHLRRLVVAEGASLPPTLAQYCHKEGDVAPYQVKFAQFQRLQAIKQAEKAARKAAKAAAAAAKAR